MYKPSFIVSTFVFLTSFFSANAVFQRGNLVITQPNEVVTLNFLAETTPKGDFVAYHSPQFNGHAVQPVDIHCSSNRCLFLDFRFGVFETSGVSADIKSSWFVNTKDGIGCSLESLAEAPSGDVFALSLDRYCVRSTKRQSALHRFSRNGTYLGVVLAQPEMGAAMSASVDSKGRLWVVQINGTVASYSLPAAADMEGTARFIRSYDFHTLAPALRYGFVHELPGDSDTHLLASLHPDSLISFSASRGVVLSRLYEHGVDPKNGTLSGTPSGFAFDPTHPELVYVENADSEFVQQERVQVYNLTSQTYTLGFGNSFLAQTFNGITFVP